MSDLCDPLKINNLILRNRLVMPPMALDIATEKGEVTPKILAHYSSRASSCMGVGLIIVEHAMISPCGKAHPYQLGIYDDTLIPGLKLLVDEIHRKRTPAGIQINHTGARALYSPSVSSTPFAPSPINCPHLSRSGQAEKRNEELPRELSVEEIKELTGKYAEAALRVKKAGFDLVEIHGAHGYLLNQFYSPITNRRSDTYGGNLENRLRFPLEVIKAVKKVVGPEMPVFYRLGADDRLPGGNQIEDSAKAVPLLEEAGVDCLDLSGGLGGYIKKGPEGFFTYLAEGIKPVAKVPVMVTGGIRNPFTAEQIVRTGKADLVGIGRALLTDPDWASKAWQTLRNHQLKDNKQE